MPRPTWDNLDEARRERVLHAAMAEFGSRGYSAGSLNVIARQAGVAKGSLFQYFEDKFDLFAYVAEQTSVNIYAAMTPLLQGPDEGEYFVDYFARLVQAWMTYMAEHQLERAVTSATNLELDPQIRLAIREPVHRLYTLALRPMIEAAVGRGDLPAGTDVDALLAMLILLLPHLAMAPFEPGFDAALPLFGASPAVRGEHSRRLVATVLNTVLVPR